MFNKILGTDGKINILNESGTIIGIIDSNSEENLGNLKVDISNQNANSITIQTTTPKAEGNITLIINKAISKDLDYSLEQLKDFKMLNTTMNANATNKDISIASNNFSLDANFTEPTSKASLSISNSNLSTVIKNENVEIRVILEDNSIDDLLYKNPTVKIDLPEYIQNINIKSVQTLYNEELKVENQKIEDDGNTKSINISLVGSQTQYGTEGLLQGMALIINTDLELNKLTPSKEDQMQMTLTNENDTNVLMAKQGINFVAPTGVVTVDSIENYSKNGAQIVAINGEDKEGILDTYSDKKVAKVTEQLINNCDNNITDIKILGKVPMQGQNTIDTNSSQENTIDTILASGLTVDGVGSTIYYTNNNNPTTDLTNSENGWTTNITNISDVKSYLVIVTNAQMSKGDTATISYNINIPENLPHNKQFISQYKVYYNDNSQIGVVASTITSPAMKLTTGEGVELKATLTSDIEQNGVVRTGQYIKMHVNVENVGKITAQGVKATITLPENVCFVNYDEKEQLYSENTEKTVTLNLGDIETNKSSIKDYIIEIKNEYVTSENKIQYSSLANISANNLDTNFNTNEYSFNVKEGKITIQNITSFSSGVITKVGDTGYYQITVTNTSNSDINNVVVKVQLPNDVKVEEASIKNDKDESQLDTNNLSNINIEKLEQSKSQKIVIKFIVGENTEDKFSTQVSATINNDDVYYSTQSYTEKGKAQVEVLAENTEERYIKEKEEFSYKYLIKTSGTADAQNVLLESDIPEKATYIKTIVKSKDSENYVPSYTLKDENNKIQVTMLSIPANVQTEIEIVLSVDSINSNEDQIAIEDSATVSSNDSETVTLNSGKCYIQYIPRYHINNQDENADQPEKDGRYRISGIAWEDLNSNGKRDTEETKITGLKVLLISKETNSIIKDIDTQEEKITTTDSNGQYIFKNLLPGNYIIVFMYDNTVYKLTDYKKENVEDTLNSDAVNMDVEWEGKQTKAGTTDTITITDDYIRNIDIGLCKTDTFDLKLDKYISKITLSTPSDGTKTYEYDNKSLVKTEVKAKEVGKSSMVIEYKIIVKNEGNVAGYAKSVVDYLPKTSKFYSELNKDWYESENGNIYNNSLANEKINPGESKEITLIISKKLDSNSMGTVLSNSAEIYEEYNENGIADTDSIPNNNNSKEDDMSIANIVISVKTGQVIIYTLLISGVLTILALGIYEVKKRVIDKK